MMNKIFGFFLGIIVLTSCREADFKKYPPLLWEQSKVDSILGFRGETRGELINDFTDKNEVYFRCLFEGSEYQKLIELDSSDWIRSPKDARRYQRGICDLIHETKALLIYSREELGQTTILKYKDGAELYYIPNLDSIFGNYYWVNSLKRNLENAVYYEPHWYLNVEGTMFRLPD
jgi:hypothetical protein